MPSKAAKQTRFTPPSRKKRTSRNERPRKNNRSSNRKRKQNKIPNNIDFTMKGIILGMALAAGVEGNDNILINSVGERVAKAIERSGG